MATEGKKYLSAAALALERARQRLAEKDQDADLTKRAADLKAPATEPIRQYKPGLPANEAFRRNPMKTTDEYRDKAAATEGKKYLSAAALGLERARQRLAEKDQDADLTKRAADLEAPATEPIRQHKPELPTNEACRRNPMKTADEYRDKAAECERLARDGDVDLRAMYLAHAAQWRLLAEQTELLKAQAERRFVVENGCPELVEALDKEEISIATAVELACLPHAHQIKCLLEAKLHHFLQGDGDKSSS